MFNNTRNQTRNAASTASAETESPASEANELETEAAENVVEMAQAPASQAAEDSERYALLQDQFTRLAADFENFRKRVREEQESLARYGAQKTILELLPVLDNLDRASATLTENSDPKVLFKSFSLLQKNLLDSLDGLGVQKIQTIGQPFDPERHEAVNRMHSNDIPENAVVYEAQSGYMLHGKVIRPAQVVVSMGASEETPAAAESAENPFVK